MPLKVPVELGNSPFRSLRVPVRSYRDLIVWQKAMDLATLTNRFAGSLPSHERFCLAAQLNRAAVSIPSNLAEGHERKSPGDYRRHVSIARGSLAELETQFELCLRLGYSTSARLDGVLSLTGEVGRMLTGLLRRLRTP